MNIKVDLHYTHMDSKLRKTESKKVDIGRPLVASCQLHRRTHAANNCKTKRDSAHSMGNISRSKSQQHKTLAGPCRPFTRKAECVPEGARRREPEENDENELQECTTCH